MVKGIQPSYLSVPRFILAASGHVLTYERGKAIYDKKRVKGERGRNIYKEV